MKYKQKCSFNVNKGATSGFFHGSETNLVFFDLRLCSVLILSLSHCPAIISHHMGVSPSLILLFNDLFVLVKSFPLFINESSKIFKKSNRMGKQEEDFDAHLNIQPFKLFYHIDNQMKIIVDFSVAQEILGRNDSQASLSTGVIVCVKFLS